VELNTLALADILADSVDLDAAALTARQQLHQQSRLLRHASAAHVLVRIPWAAPFSLPVEIEISGVRLTLNLDAAMTESRSSPPMPSRAARGAPALPQAASGASRYRILLSTIQPFS
jgi:hypothetical protein